jgi:hypothetical protein
MRRGSSNVVSRYNETQAAADEAQINLVHLLEAAGGGRKE